MSLPGVATLVFLNLSVGAQQRQAQNIGPALARQHAPEGKRLPGVTFGGVMATDREP